MSQSNTLPKNRVKLLLLLTIVFSSCASYRYNNQNKNNSFSVSTDVSDFAVIHTNKKINSLYRYQAVNGSVNVKLDKLKRKYFKLAVVHPNYDSVYFELNRRIRTGAMLKDGFLSIFTFGIPLFDFFNPNFYKLAKKSKSFYFKLNYSKEYITREYDRISNSNSTDAFKKFRAKFVNSKYDHLALNKIDSLELQTILGQQSESLLDNYILSHPNSAFLNNAKRIKAQLEEARISFEKAKNTNSVEGYEAFLNSYPNTIHTNSANKLLLDAIEFKALSSLDINYKLNYILNQLIPKHNLINQSDLNSKVSSISINIENLLINLYDKHSEATQRSDYSKLWRRYINIKDSIPSSYLNEFNQLKKYVPKISNIIFNDLKIIDSEASQIQIVNQIKKEFPKLYARFNSNKEVILSLLESQTSAEGKIKIYNVDFYNHLIKDVYNYQQLNQYRRYYYQGYEYEVLNSITMEELSFQEGKLNAHSKMYTNSILDFVIDLKSNLTPNEIDYYASGVKVKSIYFNDDGSNYSYEYRDGVNLVLKPLEDDCVYLQDLITQAESSLRLKNKLFYKNNNIDNINQKVSEIEQYIAQNNLPSSNAHVQKTQNLIKRLTAVIKALYKQIKATS